jgi:hypothetical protein
VTATLTAPGSTSTGHDDDAAISHYETEPFVALCGLRWQPEDVAHGAAGNVQRCRACVEILELEAMWSA